MVKASGPVDGDIRLLFVQLHSPSWRATTTVSLLVPTTADRRGKIWLRLTNGAPHGQLAELKQTIKHRAVLSHVNCTARGDF